MSRNTVLPQPIRLDDPRLHPQQKMPIPDASTPWYRIVAAGDEGNDSTTDEIWIYGAIGGSFWDDGVTANDFARDLAAIDSDAITVRINSPGGSVWDGIAILNALRAHKATITTVVDGVALSAASFIAMGGDEVVMMANATMMIHDASGLCVGDASEMQDYVNLLNKTSDNIASIYAAKAGGTPKQWRALMTAETWYSDTETVAAGLADRVDKGTSKTDTGAKNTFDLSVFNYAGRRKAPPPAFPANSSADRAGATNKEQQMSQTLKAAIAKSLGMSADATDDELIEKLAEEDGGDSTTETTTTGTEGGEDTTTGTETTTAGTEGGEGTTSTTTDKGTQNRARTPGTPGTVVVDEQRLANLEANSARLTEFLDAQTAAANKKVIDNAVQTGKIPTARREHWSTLLDKDPGIADVLAAMPAGGAVPVGEIGHGVDASEGGQSTSASSLDAITNSPEFKNWSE